MGVIQDQICFSKRAVTYTSPGGDAKHLTVTAQTVMDEAPGSSQPRGILVMINDIKDMMLLMQGAWQLFRERAESLDRLARAVAHEIRNPTTAIGGLAGRLLFRWAGGYQVETISGGNPGQHQEIGSGGARGAQLRGVVPPKPQEDKPAALAEGAVQRV